MVWIWLVLAFLISLWVASVWFILSSCSCIPSKPSFLSRWGEGRNVLLAMAHPDDESMFFAPTILSLVSQGHNVYLLCLSVGNADGRGNLRREELYKACTVLKVRREQVKILDHPNLQDGFDMKWDHELVAELVRDHIEQWDIDSVITFDNYGVSGHPNHRDVHHGICKIRNMNLQRDIEAWELISTSILRKYSGPLGIWISLFCYSSYSKRNMYLVLNRNPETSYRAMAQHYSQWVWFRKLFVLFSSYTYMNMLRKIDM